MVVRMNVIVIYGSSNDDGDGYGSYGDGATTASGVGDGSDDGCGNDVW